WSKNSKQLGEYKSSMEALSSAIDNVGRTLDVINSKDPLSSISTESINARATAVNELASAFENSLQKLKITDQTANSWDRFIDGWKSVTGSDLLSTSAKDFSLAISKAIEGASGKQKTNATQKLVDILGVNPKDFDQVFKLLSQSPRKLLEVAPKISAVLKQLGIEMSNIGSRAKQLDEAFITAGKAYDAVLFSQLPSDNLAKLGMESINVSNQMTEAFKDPSTALSQLATIAGDVSKLRFLDPKNAVELYNMSGAIKKSASDLQLYKNTLVNIEEQEEKLQQTRKKLSEMYDQKTASGRSQLKTQLERAGAGGRCRAGIKNSKNQN
ncbi:MAG: hypothetical protein IPK52_20590, partial [Chloroflexi bacterium]|nr:hypothetical protein [Chloroflexota bacterium]